jgi:hypothetical protein
MKGRIAPARDFMKISIHSIEAPKQEIAMNTRRITHPHSHKEAVPADRAEAAAAAGVSRRGFLGRAAAVTATAGVFGGLPLRGMTTSTGATADAAASSAVARADRAYSVRVDAARVQRARPLLDHPTNGDEALYATTHIGNYSKGLPHNQLGEVDPRHLEIQEEVR